MFIANMLQTVVRPHNATVMSIHEEKENINRKRKAMVMDPWQVILSKL